MAKLELARVHSKSAGAKFAFAALFALSLLFAQSLLVKAYADKKPDNKPLDPCFTDKKPHGCLKLSTNPGGNPLLIDGNDAGATTVNDRYISLAPGVHSVEVIFPNGERWTHDVNIVDRRIYCVGLTYAPRTIPIPNKLPCPYPVNVSASTTVAEGEMITFSSDVKYTGSSALNYTWTVSPASAKIISGAGTQTIDVDTTGLGGQKVSAILVVDDGSGESSCRVTAQASTDVTRTIIKTKCYDCFPFIAFDDTKARLDNFAIELQNNPSAQGYMIVYSGTGSRAGQAERLIERAKDYLMKERTLDVSRLTVINGGYRDTDYFELWVVPQGAEPPTPTPTAQSGSTQPPEPASNRRPRRSRRE